MKIVFLLCFYLEYYNSHSLFIPLPSSLLPLGFLHCGPPGGSHWSARVQAAVGELLFVCRFQDLEGAHQSFVHRHHGTCVIKLATIVGGGEESDQLPLGEKLVPVLHHLVSSTYQVEVVFVEELGHHLGPEGEADPPVVLAPAH